MKSFSVKFLCSSLPLLETKTGLALQHLVMCLSTTVLLDWVLQGVCLPRRSSDEIREQRLVCFSRTLPEAAHPTGSAFKSSSLRGLPPPPSSSPPHSNCRTEGKNPNRLSSHGGAPLAKGNLPVEDSGRPTQSHVRPP